MGDGEYKNVDNTEEVCTFLEDEIRKLEECTLERKKEHCKTLVVQNLRLFKGMANFVMPYVLIGALTCGSFTLFNGGLPFVLDDVKKYKRYDVYCDQNVIEEMNTKYIERHWYSDVILGNKMVIYTPWTSDGRIYTRQMVTLGIDETYNEQVMDALLCGDVVKLTELLSVVRTVEESTLKEQVVDGTYYIDATLHQINKEEMLTYPESEVKNAVITFVEALITLGVGSFAVWCRDFSIVATINDIKFKIKSSRDAYRNLNKELQAKRLILSNKGECKNEK